VAMATTIEDGDTRTMSAVDLTLDGVYESRGQRLYLGQKSMFAIDFCGVWRLDFENGLLMTNEKRKERGGMGFLERVFDLGAEKREI